MFGTERKWRNVCLTLSGMILLTFSTIFVSFVSEPSSAYTTRSGIYIYNDSQFLLANGVTDGIGTESDPYIIEGWYIYVMPIGTCIEIINTRAHFVIRNCSLQGDSFSVGPDIIELDNVQNGTVENVVGFGMAVGSGLVARTCSNLTVTNNSFDGDGYGVRLSGCHDIRVFDNDLTDNRYAGISLASSWDILVRDNNVHDNQDPNSYGGDGVTLSDCSNITITHNNMTGNSGVGLWETTCSGVTISNNSFALNGWHRSGLPLTRNATGIYIHRSTDTNLGENNLTGEGVYIYHETEEEYTTISLNTSNTVNGDPIRFFRDSVGVRCEGIPTGQLIVINCSDVKVSGITIGPASVGMMIKHATDVEIADCRIHGNMFNGLELWDITNVTLSACNLSENAFQLVAEQFTNLTLSSCGIHGYGGVYLTRGDYANVSGNVFENPISWAFRGLSMSSANHLVVSGNNISGYMEGVHGEGCDDVVIEGNDVFDNEQGPGLWKCSHFLVVDNNLTSNVVGLRLVNCAGGLVYHNNFQSSQAIDYVNTDTRWNESYPIGGNYWSDYAGTDERRGPAQDEIGADGIGDTPYSIYMSAEDRYPLMRPANMPNTVPVASFTAEPLAGDVATVFQLNASGAWDKEDSIDVLEVRWDFEGDGIWDTGWTTEMNASHQFGAAGTYNVTVEVRDSGGLTNTSTVQVVVTYVIPEFDVLLIAIVMAAVLAIVLFVFSWKKLKSSPK